MDKNSDSPSISVCGIGASAGGIEALQQFFTDVPGDLGLAYVVVVHLAPDRKSELPSIIGRCTRMPVVQVGDSEQLPLVANQVYVIAPGRKLEINATTVGAAAFTEPRGQRAAIDLLFRSLAEGHHGDGFAVVLSGIGSDGALGAKAVKEKGGVVLVQDPSEASHDAMPRAVLATGVADLVLPVRELVARLVELVRNRERLLPLVGRAQVPKQMPPLEEEALMEVLVLLRKRTGNDFSQYKRSTILRRLSRRMQLSRQLRIIDYCDYLQGNDQEVRALLDDLLISVTAFFRDPQAWAALQAQVIAPLVEQADAERQIRCWVPACATGEEAYTLAILLHEEFERCKRRPNLLLFASDLDEAALAVGRVGSYPLAVATDIGERRFNRYFKRFEDQCTIDEELRDSIVFATHSLLRDPPFSRLDLVTCRNLLIYLDGDLQQQVMGIFRYALRKPGYLFLGASEFADEERFLTLDKKQRIFRTRDAVDRPALPDLLGRPSAVPLKREYYGLPRRGGTAMQLHLATLEDTAPPTVLVDERQNVVHVSATAARFFQQGSGPLARHAAELVRPELRDQLHALLGRALETPGPHSSRAISVALEGASHQVVLVAQQRTRGLDEPLYALVTFIDMGPVWQEGSGDRAAESGDRAAESGDRAAESGDRAAESGDRAAESGDRAAESGDGTAIFLRAKLRESEQRLESMRDDYYLSNEELRAANEELQSLNEEYRSTTEELETSKEELQSVNEELETVNNELSAKLEDISRAHADLENLITSTNVATVFLDKDLRIKRFTAELATLFNVRPGDINRPIADLRHSLDYDTLEDDARRVLAEGGTLERDAQAYDGRSFIARLSPYVRDRETDGVVITFVDVSAIRRAEAEQRAHQRELQATLESTRRLHHMSITAATASDLSIALDEILATAIDLHQAQFGTLQLLDPGSRILRIAAQHGFRPAFLKRFETVSADDGTACGRALQGGAPCQIADVEADPMYAPHRAAAAEAGYRAVQAVPLVSRTGEILGVMSVHFRETHVFTPRDRQLADLLGQQAADLIEMRTHQKKIMESNDILVRRCADLEASRAEFARHTRDLQEQDRHRQEFFAALGHELRNPLAAIQSSLPLISIADDRSRLPLEVLSRQVRHMTRLVNDLVDMTRISHGRLRLERAPLDLKERVLAALEAIRPQAGAKGLSLEHQLPGEALTVLADPERLAQILGNLLRNAVTYTDVGNILVTARREGRYARVVVRDTGVGIDPADARGLFRPYQQRDDGRRSSGLGLGLTVVRGLVEAHGGGIDFHSEGRGKGSQFSFTLPLSDAPMPVRATAISPRLPPRRILVVDDQPDVADMFAAMLRTLGQDVEVAYDGDAALAAARRQTPQAAFLDISMPGMDGSELARRLRVDFPAAELTLVALTGIGNPSGTSREFDYYLLKPVSAETVIKLLSSLRATTLPA